MGEELSIEQLVTRLVAVVHGRVQGVGFRWWTRCRAREYGLVGSARNLPDGRVEVIAQGSKRACQQLLSALRGGGTPGTVEQVEERWAAPQGDLTGFAEL